MSEFGRHHNRDSDFMDRSKRKVEKYKTVFISDIHLGSKACQAELLLDFSLY